MWWCCDNAAHVLWVQCLRTWFQWGGDCRQVTKVNVDTIVYVSLDAPLMIRDVRSAAALPWRSAKYLHIYGTLMSAHHWQARTIYRAKLTVWPYTIYWVHTLSPPHAVDLLNLVYSSYPCCAESVSVDHQADDWHWWIHDYWGSSAREICKRRPCPAWEEGKILRAYISVSDAFDPKPSAFF